jgi:predicted nucleic acid-binding protein
MVIASFLRLVTHPAVFVEPTPMLDALRFIDAWLAAAVMHQGERLVSFDADFKHLLPRNQFARLATA